MALGSLMNRRAISKEKLRELQENARLQKIAEERLLSANERELKRRMDQEREELMAEELKEIRRHETSTFFRSNMFFNQDKQMPVQEPEPGSLGRGSMLNSSNMFFK